MVIRYGEIEDTLRRIIGAEAFEQLEIIKSHFKLPNLATAATQAVKITMEILALHNIGETITIPGRDGYGIVELKTLGELN